MEIARGSTLTTEARQAVHALLVIGVCALISLRPGVDAGKVAQSPLFATTLGVFELIYFARPDSFQFGKQVYRIRQRIGQTLANVETASSGLSGSMKDLPQVMASLKQMLNDENMKRFGNTLANLEKVSGEGAAFAADLRKLVANLQGLTKKIDALAGEAGGELAQTTLPRLNVLLQELSVNSRQMSRLLDQIEDSPNMLIFGREARRPGPGEAGFSAR